MKHVQNLVDLCYRKSRCSQIHNVPLRPIRITRKTALDLFHCGYGPIPIQACIELHLHGVKLIIID